MAKMSRLFLDGAPRWYAQALAVMLIANPLIALFCGKFLFGWLLLGEFIFTLAMALKYYPFVPAGLLVGEACFLGMLGERPAELMMGHTKDNIGVVLLLMFIVPAVGMTKELMLFCFSRVLLGIRSKTLVAVLFCCMGAALSAWLDALTVTAVIVMIAYGCYATYHAYASERGAYEHAHHIDDRQVRERHRIDLEEFRGFLRDILMHGVVGTTLGGVMTLVGEPQNLIIGEKMGWDFTQFFFMMFPVTLPTLIAGLFTCVIVERLKICGYGYTLPQDVATVLEEKQRKMEHDTARYVIQGIGILLIVIGLGIHIAEVGFVGLGTLILLNAFAGKPTDEHTLAKVFGEAMPFASLLIIFFILVAMIETQQLFQPIMHAILALSGKAQLAAMYAMSGLLSCVSDNVFVGLIGITEVRAECVRGGVESARQCNLLAVAVNAGTNLPSVATPNGQAALLFLLTQPIAGLVRLGYGRMCLMALPYTIVLTLTGLLSVLLFL